MNLFKKNYKKKPEAINQDEIKPYIKESDLYPEQRELKEQREAKQIINRTGLALFCLAAAVLGSQYFLSLIIRRYLPWMIQTSWYVWFITAITMVGIGFPVYYAIMRRIPDSPRGEIVRMSPLQFLIYFLICCGAMYITNILSNILTVIIALLKGDHELLNPAQLAILNSNILISILYASVIAPIIEELIFRKLLLNKLRRFGDVPAIILSGAAFGLFHMNLSQFFYAAVLGGIFAYITLKMNTVRYSILLHMIINFIGVSATLFVSEKNLIGIIILYQWIFASILAGVLLFIFNFKKIRLDKGSASPVRWLDYIINPGAILYLSICLIAIVITTIVPA